MISVFPSLYPDELMYSLLCRYAVRSGYLVYRAVAEDLMMKPLEHPSILFCNRLTEDVKSHLSVSPSEIIHQHTMFDYYARFTDSEKRTKLFQALAVGDMRTFGNGVSLRHDRSGHFLRYCPVCAQNDRDLLGETYWHRSHQLPEVCVCPIHGCPLHNSTVSTASGSSPAFRSADETVPLHSMICPCVNEREWELARYASEVFHSEYNAHTSVSVGSFLHSKLEYTPYRTHRGQSRNLTLLHNDLTAFYRGIDLHGFTETWQLTKLLCGERHNFFEICTVAFFLGIRPNELSDMTLPTETQTERFDRTVTELRSQGLNSTQISEQLGGASVNIIKPVATGAYFHKYDRRPHHEPKPKRKVINWSALDAEYLPLVREAIRKMSDMNGENRPVRVSVGAVCREAGLAGHRIESMPKCLAQIREQEETRDQFVARCLVWGYRKCLADQKEITRTRVLARVNIKISTARNAAGELKRIATAKEELRIREALGW